MRDVASQDGAGHPLHLSFTPDNYAAEQKCGRLLGWGRWGELKDGKGDITDLLRIEIASLLDADSKIESDGPLFGMMSGTVGAAESSGCDGSLGVRNSIDEDDVEGFNRRGRDKRRRHNDSGFSKWMWKGLVAKVGRGRGRRSGSCFDGERHTRCV